MQSLNAFHGHPAYLAVFAGDRSFRDDAISENRAKV
jgi:hypothetical protein